MSAITTQLSDSDGWGAFHDLIYINDNHGGKHNITTFEIHNQSGYSIGVDLKTYEDNPVTGKREEVWTGRDDWESVRITIQGGAESSEFLQMLQLIIETERMVEIIKP